MIKSTSILFLLFYLVSCSSSHKWPGGIITDDGVYENNGLKIIVTDHDHSIDYVVFDSKGGTLIKSDRKFSSFQRWALHLDRDQNLWVFSSDVGDACWKIEPTNKKYIKREFYGLISKDSIPGEVYNTLKHFHPYNSQE